MLLLLLLSPFVDEVGDDTTDERAKRVQQQCGKINDSDLRCCHRGASYSIEEVAACVRE